MGDAPTPTAPLGSASRATPFEGLCRQITSLRTAALANAGDRESLLTMVATIAGEATRSDRAAVYLVDDRNGSLSLGGAYGYDAALSATCKSLTLGGALERALSSGRPRLLSAGDLPRDGLASLGVEGFDAIVPLQATGEILGMLLLGRASDHAYSDDDVLAAEVVAGELARELEASQLRAEVRRVTADFALIHSLGEMIAGEFDIKTMLQSGARDLARIADVPQSFLFLIDEESGGLRATATNLDDVDVQGVLVARDEPSASVQALIEQRPILIQDVEHPGNDSLSTTYARRFDQRSVMALPSPRMACHSGWPCSARPAPGGGSRRLTSCGLSP